MDTVSKLTSSTTSPYIHQAVKTEQSSDTKEDSSHLSFAVRPRSSSTSKPNILFTLPHEVLRLIVDEITEDEDLLSLCLTSKLLNTIASSFFYGAITITCPEGYNPRDSALKQFSTSKTEIIYNPNLRHVQELTLHSEMREKVYPGTRCWHQRILLSDAEEADEEFGSKTLSTEVAKVPDHLREKWNDSPKFYQDDFYKFCEALAPDHLKSFSWHLGTCIPGNILGPGGYLPQYQRDLEELYLLTDGSCRDDPGPPVVYDFSKFRRLRELCWLGVTSKHDFIALKEGLKIHREKLKVLEIDVVNWGFAAWEFGSGQAPDPNNRQNFFAEGVLGLSLDIDVKVHPVLFPNLQNLILGQIYFKHATTQLAEAFPFTQLKKLTLWRCVGITALFRYLAGKNINYPLEFLEITNGYDGDEETEDDQKLGAALSKFMSKINGLHDLRLCLPFFGFGWRGLNPAIFKHLPTLKRLVIHSRTWNVNPGSLYFEQEEDGEIGYDNEIATIFSQGNCEFLGLRCTPQQVRQQLETTAKDSTCKVLHLRASRDWMDRADLEDRVEIGDVASLADWIFSPDGLPNLCILAYGDYLFPSLVDDADDDENVVFVRKGPDDPDDPVESEEGQDEDGTDADEWEDVDDDKTDEDDENDGKDEETENNDNDDGEGESDEEDDGQDEDSKKEEKVNEEENEDEDADQPVYFRNMRSSDKELYKLLHEHVDAMGACRFKPLVSVDPDDFDRHRRLFDQLP